MRTSRPTRRDEEIATEVAPFSASMFDAKQLRDVVAAQVYPRIEIDVRTFDRPDEKRLAVIVVQQQDDDRRPFLLTRVFDDERRWEAMALGWAPSAMARATLVCRRSWNRQATPAARSAG